MTRGSTSKATDLSIADGTVGLELHNASSLDLHGGELSKLGGECALGAKVLGLYNASSLTLDAVNMHDSCGAIELHNASSATITGATIKNVGPEHAGLGSTIEVGEASSLHLVDTAISEGHGPAIYAFSAGALVDITGGSIHAADNYGLSLGVSSASIHGTSLVGPGTAYGIHLDFGALALSDVAISQFLVGVHQAGGTAKIRGTTITGSAYGVLFLGGSLDLGTPADLGKNMLQGNTDTAVYVGSSANVTIAAAGNGWLPSVQGVSYLGVFANHGTIFGPYGADAPLPRNLVLTGFGPKLTY
jgi:hypothetical protein